MCRPLCAMSDQQPDGLERDGLAAGVGTGDDQGACAGLRIDIDRHDRFRIEQRMAGLQKLHRWHVRCGRSLRPVHGAWDAWTSKSRGGSARWRSTARAYLALAKARSSTSQVLHAVGQFIAMRADQCGKLRQDAALLIPLRQLQLADFIIKLHDGQRLDEQGGPR